MGEFGFLTRNSLGSYMEFMRDCRGKRNKIHNWCWSHSCDILTMHLAAICQCLKTLTATRSKNKWLVLENEISRQHNIDSVACLLLILLKLSMLKNTNGIEKKCTVWRGREYPDYQLAYCAEREAVLKGISISKERQPVRKRGKVSQGKTRLS